MSVLARPASWFVVATVAAVSSTGCADEDRAVVSPSGGQEEDAACAAAEEIVALDDLVEEGIEDAPATAEGFEQFLDEFNETSERELPALMETYDQLAANVPADLRTDVEALASFTERIVGEIAEVESPEELAALFDPEDPELDRVVDATFALDEWSRETCDIVIADD
jgi:hypothetical protein